MSRQAEWAKGKKAQGCAIVRAILTTEATQALERVAATRTITQSICQAIIELDNRERNNAKHH
jgi:DNA-binding TFAR19-related protein (PDSD5 family)